MPLKFGFRSLLAALAVAATATGAWRRIIRAGRSPSWWASRPAASPTSPRGSMPKRSPEITGQRVTVENRTGAGGGVAAAAVQNAAPDGHTLLVFSGSQHATVPAVEHRDL